MPNKTYFILGLIFVLLMAEAPLHVFNVPNVFFPVPIYIFFSKLIGISWLSISAIYTIIWLLFFDKNLEAFKLRSDSLNGILTFLCLFWMIISRSYGLEHQGLLYYTICLIVNILFLAFSWYVWRAPSFLKVRLYTIVMSVYLTVYFVPYLGEML